MVQPSQVEDWCGQGNLRLRLGYRDWEWGWAWTGLWGFFVGIMFAGERYHSLCHILIYYYNHQSKNKVNGNMNLFSKTTHKKYNETLKKAKSYDDLTSNLNRTSELSFTDIKILLSCDHTVDECQQLSHRIKKQEILQRNRLFDPAKMFGLAHSQSVQQSARNNSARLGSMFDSLAGSKNNSCSKRSGKKETLIMGKTLNSYLRDNKENYQKNGGNTLQKVKIKLKLRTTKKNQ